MQEKHEQLGEFGAIPGAPNGPPTDNLSQSRKDAENGNGSRSVDENAPECSLPAPEIPTPEKLTPAPAVLCDSAPLRESEKSEQKCAFSPREFEIHAAANIFPPMSDAEFAAFAADIRVNGQSDPIWIFEGKVIDGRHRLRACRELGIEPKFQEWDGKGSLTSFVLSRNLHRRHLNESQRAMVAAQLKPAFEAEAKQRMLAGKELDPSAPVRQGKTAREAGEALNISARSVENATRVLVRGIPALIDAVSRGQIKVKVAAELASYSREDQERILAKGPAAIREAAAFWKKQDKEHEGPRKTYQQFVSFSLGLNRVHKEDFVYKMEVDHEFREQIASILEDEDNLLRAINYGLLIKKKREDVA